MKTSELFAHVGPMKVTIGERHAHGGPEVRVEIGATIDGELHVISTSQTMSHNVAHPFVAVDAVCRVVRAALIDAIGAKR